MHQSKPYWFVVSNIVAVQRVNNTNMRGITSFNSHTLLPIYSGELVWISWWPSCNLRTGAQLGAICFNVLWLLNGISQNRSTRRWNAIKWISMRERSVREFIAIFLFSFLSFLYIRTARCSGPTLVWIYGTIINSPRASWIFRSTDL